MQTMEHTAGLGFEVAVGEIDRRLRQLWETNDSFCRASLMNLVIYSEGGDSLMRNTELVADLTQEHACRVVLVEAWPECEERAVRAWITAHCNLSPRGGKSVCCEQVAFQLHGLSPGRLTNIIFAHLEADVPLVLWWQASFCGHFHQRIYSRIDRLIFDSREWKEPLEEFNSLYQAYRDKTNHFVVHDLNWTRTFQLRLALAACFESQASLRSLQGLQEITVIGAAESYLTRVLFVAWMAVRLDATFLQGAANRFTLRLGETREIALAIVDDGSKCPVSKVTLVADGAAFELRCEDGGDFYIVSSAFAGDGTRTAMLPADKDQLNRLLIDQLGRGGSNQGYFQVVNMAVAILRHRE